MATLIHVLLTRLPIREDHRDEIVAWQAEAVTLASGFPGFVNAEAKPPTSSGKMEWITIQRFTGAGELQAWQISMEWLGLLEKAQQHLPEGIEPITEVRVDNAESSEGVTEVIITKVKPGCEDAYRAWETRAQQAQARFPGYLGSYVQPPSSASQGWTTLMRFATPAQLENWLNSSERAALLKESAGLIDYAHVQHVPGSFPGWFPTDPRTGNGPPNWKAAMLVLLGLYPIVMLEVRFLSPLLASLNSAFATFVGNSLSVALTTWGTMPIFVAMFGWWLFPKNPGRSTDLRGALVILAGFAAEVAVLWHLLY